MPLNSHFCIQHEKTYCANCFAEQAPFVQLEMLGKQSAVGRKKGGVNLSGMSFWMERGGRTDSTAYGGVFLLSIKMMGLYLCELSLV